MIDRKVCEELKCIAKEKGQDWKQMTCEVILNFCEKCSEKGAKTETEKGEKEGKIRIVRESELENGKESPIGEEKGFIEVLKEAIVRE